jgi:secondary thiamine-phosphate synthase enzyme
MKQHQRQIFVQGRGPGLIEITEAVNQAIQESGIETGLCHIFLQHTSASLLIQENADPTARHDLVAFFDRLAPENDPAYRHTAEGPDDMPAHLKASLTNISEQIPVRKGRLALGTWQGLYLFEHRRSAPRRTAIVHVMGE